jgi:hypothetical protein
MHVQLDALMSQIEQRVAEAVQSGLQKGLAGISAVQQSAKAGSVRVKKAAAALAGKAPCLATGCGNAAKSRGLCAAHYQKARRLKINGANLNQEQRDLLGTDGRALRFKKKGKK